MSFEEKSPGELWFPGEGQFGRTSQGGRNEGRPVGDLQISAPTAKGRGFPFLLANVATSTSVSAVREKWPGALTRCRGRGIEIG